MMANVLNIHTMEYRKSANTPDYMDGNWLINPVLPDCDKKYWKLGPCKVVETDMYGGGLMARGAVVEMSSSEKKVVNDAEKAKKDRAEKKSNREQLIQERMRKIAEDQLIAEGLMEVEGGG